MATNQRALTTAQAGAIAQSRGDRGMACTAMSQPAPAARSDVHAH